MQTRRLMRAHERPQAVLFHPLHEKIRDPHGVKQVPSPALLLARILLCIQELEDIRMPRLQVDGEGTRPLKY